MGSHRKKDIKIFKLLNDISYWEYNLKEDYDNTSYVEYLKKYCLEIYKNKKALKNALCYIQQKKKQQISNLPSDYWRVVFAEYF